MSGRSRSRAARADTVAGMVRSVVLVVCFAACGFRSPPGMVETADATSPEADASGVTASLVLEAEAFSSMTVPTDHQWTSATDETGYSGASFMQCLPNNGAACPDAGQVPVCGASLVYQIAIAQPASYFFHVRTLAHTKSDDSIWYGLDGVVDPKAMDLPNDGTWRWTTGDSFSLGAGPHTLHVWQREGGARVDVVALTTSSSPPP